MRTADSLAPVVLTDKPAASTRWLSVGHDDHRNASEAGTRAATEALRGDADSVLRSSQKACADAIARLDGNPPIGIVAFDCIGRRGVLGEEGIQTEVERIRDSAPGTPVAGFYTYGEIARTSGVNAVHSQTLAVLALS